MISLTLLIQRREYNMAIHNFNKDQEYLSNPQPDHRNDGDKLNSLISIYDHSNPDIAYAEKEAEELIHNSGAWMKLYATVDNIGKVDETYEEDPEPQYSEPIELKGYFVPDPIATSMKKWGGNSVSQFKVTFARAYLYQLTNGRLIREGDVLHIPHNTLAQTARTYFKEGPDFEIVKFEVLHSRDVGNFNYRWLYWECTVKNMTGDTSIGPRK